MPPEIWIEVVARDLYTTAMMQRRNVQITAWILIFIISTIVLEGYDVLSGGNITEMFIEPIHRGCFG